MDAILRTITQSDWFKNTGLIIVVIIGLTIVYKILMSSDIFYKIGLFLEWSHSAAARYYGTVLSVIAGETFFSFRAASVYSLFLGPIMSGGPQIGGYPVFLLGACCMIGLLVASGGFYVATHGPQATEKRKYYLLATIIIAHDWAGILLNDIFSLKGKDEGTIAGFIVASIFLCGISFMPIILGRWVAGLHKEKIAEEDERHNQFEEHNRRKMEAHAIRQVSKHALKIKPADVWMLLPEGKRAYGKQLMLIASGKVAEEDLLKSEHREDPFDEEEDLQLASPQLRRVPPALSGPAPIEGDFEEEEVAPPRITGELEAEQEVIQEEASVPPFLRRGLDLLHQIRNEIESH